MSRRATHLLLTAPTLAVGSVALVFIVLRGQLPAQMTRHVGADGIGTSSTLLVIAVMTGLSIAAFLIGVWTYKDFTALKHWYMGNKSIVVCSLATGYGLCAMALATMISGMATAAAGAASIGVSLLSLLAGFAIAAGVLVKVLPEAMSEGLEQD